MTSTQRPVSETSIEAYNPLVQTLDPGLGDSAWLYEVLRHQESQVIEISWSPHLAIPNERRSNEKNDNVAGNPHDTDSGGYNRVHSREPADLQALRASEMRPMQTFIEHIFWFASDFLQEHKHAQEVQLRKLSISNQDPFDKNQVLNFSRAQTCPGGAA